MLATTLTLVSSSLLLPQRVPSLLTTRTSQPRCSASDYLADVPEGAPDAILGIAANFRASTAPNKVNLAVGAYRDDSGTPFVLPSVREAEQRLLARGEKKEYAPIDGLPSFKKLALEFAYGEGNAALSDGRISGVQTLSGTGACRIAGEFYSRFLPKGTVIYVSDPTWGNHIVRRAARSARPLRARLGVRSSAHAACATAFKHQASCQAFLCVRRLSRSVQPIMQLAGLEVRRYRYLNRESNTLDLEGYLADIADAPPGSVFLLHACAHNPTGVDPTRAEWTQISDAILQKGHHVLMDCAYQVVLPPDGPTTPVPDSTSDSGLLSPAPMPSPRPSPDQP